MPPPQRIELTDTFLTPAKTFPSRMASVLSGTLHSPRNPPCERIAACGVRPYALYAAFGYAHLPCAVEKVRLSDHTRLRDHCALLCHDVPLVNGKLPDGVFAACNQDVYAEGRQAMEIAHHYLTYSQFPAQKRIYIPSTILERAARPPASEP